MTPKLVARVIVFVVSFLLITQLIEASGLVSLSVQSNIDSGNVEVAAAPRLTAMVEYLVAGVFAIFATTHTLGDKAADLLVKLWELIRAKVQSTYRQDSGAVESDGLDPDKTIAALKSMEKRIKALEISRNTQDVAPPVHTVARKRSASNT